MNDGTAADVYDGGVPTTATLATTAPSRGPSVDGIATDADRSVCTIDVTLSSLYPLRGGGGRAVRCLKFTPDGRYLLALFIQLVWVIDVSSDCILRVLRPPGSSYFFVGNTIQVSGDGSTVVCSCLDRNNTTPQGLSRQLAVWHSRPQSSSSDSDSRGVAAPAEVGPCRLFRPTSTGIPSHGAFAVEHSGAFVLWHCRGRVHCFEVLTGVERTLQHDGVPLAETGVVTLSPPPPAVPRSDAGTEDGTAVGPYVAVCLEPGSCGMTPVALLRLPSSAASAGAGAGAGPHVISRLQGSHKFSTLEVTVVGIWPRGHLVAVHHLSSAATYTSFQTTEPRRAWVDVNRAGTGELLYTVDDVWLGRTAAVSFSPCGRWLLVPTLDRSKRRARESRGVRVLVAETGAVVSEVLPEPGVRSFHMPRFLGPAGQFYAALNYDLGVLVVVRTLTGGVVAESRPPTPGSDLVRRSGSKYSLVGQLVAQEGQGPTPVCLRPDHVWDGGSGLRLAVCPRVSDRTGRRHTDPVPYVLAIWHIPAALWRREASDGSGSGEPAAKKGAGRPLPVPVEGGAGGGGGLATNAKDPAVTVMGSMPAATRRRVGLRVALLLRRRVSRLVAAALSLHTRV